MTFEEEIGEALRGSGELGSRRPNVDAMIGAIMPIINRELGIAWERGVRKAFMVTVEEPWWVPAEVLPMNPYDAEWDQ